MRKSLIAATAAVAAFIGFSAHAADNGIYLGGSIGQSSVETSDRIQDPDLGINEKLKYSTTTTGYKLIAGWRFIDWMSIEANWVDLGTGDDGVANIDGDKLKAEIGLDGWTLSALGFVPIGPVDLFARVGAFGWDSSATLKGFGERVKGSDDGVDLTYGIGAQFRVWSLAIRAEYEIFDVSDFDRTDMFSVGVTWTFL